MTLQPASKEALELLTRGAVAMARIEAAGIRIDVPYLDAAIAKTRNKITELQKGLTRYKEYRVWSRHYGQRMSMGNRAQLGKVIFSLTNHKRNPMMQKESNSEHSFEHLRDKVPFVKDYFAAEKLKKALATYLLGIRRETIDGYAHPFFHLNFAESYRSSSSDPNWQNMPVRNKYISEIVRSCVIPRKDHILIEADYGAQEVRISACYNKDPKLIDYILGGGDMHKDRAMELYMLTEEELGPTNGKTSGALIRYCAKNQFVFPQFYGSTYSQCAPNLWESIGRLHLTTSSGESLYSHLRRKGIKKLGECSYEIQPKPNTFESHVQSVEHHMWQDVFTVYNLWKHNWWTLYLKQGGVNSLTGFRMQGLFRRNQVLADCIQGSAFHCLLWSLIHIQNEMIRWKMKSKIICQIHDSLLIDVHKSELIDVVEMVREIAIEKVGKHWSWIIVPLQVEFEYSEENWYKKQPLKEIVC